jgi:MFS family permease
VFTAATLSWTGGAWIQAQRIERLGPRRFLAVGSLTLVVGVLGFATILIPTVPLIVGVVTWSIAGLGMGFSYSTLSLVVLREAAPEEQGSATAGLQLSDVLGTSLGTGLGGALVAAGIRAGSPGWVGLAETFGIAAIVGVIAFVVSGRVQTHRLTTGTGSRGSVAPSVGGAG